MKFQINQKVYYTKEKAPAAIKGFSNGKVFITYFPHGSDKRLNKLVSPGDLSELKQQRNKQTNREQKTIKVRYFANIEKLQRISVGDWIDLRAAVDVELKQGEYKLIPLGIGMKLPIGYEANVVPRSSTFKNWGVLQTNSYGVIDNSYSGNEDQWYFPAYATRDTTIKRNDRICQFRINRVMGNVEIIEVESLNDVSRGGFGSSGKQ